MEMITATNNTESEHRDVNGISVHYLPVRYDNSFGFGRRLRSFLSFSYRATRYAGKSGSFDIAYITSTPLTVGLVALRLKRKYHLPYIFEVRDLWPEAPIQAGIIRSALLKNITKYLESRTYRNAAKLVALSPGIKSALIDQRTGLPVHMCTNMSDCEFFGIEEARNNELKERYRLEDEFVIGYFGAIGKLNSLEYLLNVARVSKEKNEKIKFIVIGNGAEKSRLMEIQRTNKLDNVIFVDHVDKYELKKHLTLIDAAYVSFASLQVLESNSPNKFFDALAAGKMIILNIKGWLKESVEKNNCGFYADPENPEQFLEKLRSYRSDRSRLKQCQHNARMLAESEFEKTKLTTQLLKFIEDNI